MSEHLQHDALFSVSGTTAAAVRQQGLSKQWMPPKHELSLITTFLDGVLLLILPGSYGIADSGERGFDPFAARKADARHHTPRQSRRRVPGTRMISTRELLTMMNASINSRLMLFFQRPNHYRWRGGVRPGCRFSVEVPSLMDRIQGQVQTVGYADFAEDAVQVVFDGLLADAHLLGNSGVLKTLADQLHDLLLALAQSWCVAVASGLG